ncbi:hypothetical protein BH10PSE18_BH10PSE18_08310 [soil metagenome]
MSFAASWSYTAIATLWPLNGVDDWTHQKSFGAPITFACDYSAEAVSMTDAKGIEFTTRQVIYTERSDIKQGDFVLIGASALSSPIAAGAFEVRAITRDADTFDRLADDFQIAT